MEVLPLPDIRLVPTDRRAEPSCGSLWSESLTAEQAPDSLLLGLVHLVFMPPGNSFRGSQFPVFDTSMSWYVDSFSCAGFDIEHVGKFRAELTLMIAEHS